MDMNALDIRFMVKELRSTLVGAVVRKIYQYEKKTFMIEFFSPGKGGIWLALNPESIHITEFKPTAPEPPSFCMFLRKYLMGKRLVSIEQVGFDRLVELTFPENRVVIELIPPGNVILCDSDHQTIMPLEIQKWKTREVRHKTPYKPPPLQDNPFYLDLEHLAKEMKLSDKSVGAFLALTGLGKVYSHEVCVRANVSDSSPANSMGLEQISRVHLVLEKMDKAFSPTRYEEVVSPFELKSKQGGKHFPTLSEAWDLPPTEVKEEPEKERIERIIETQEEAKERFGQQSVERRGKADLLYEHYQLVEQILRGIRSAREQGLSWEEIREKIRQEETEGSEAIKEIKEHEGLVVVEIGGQTLSLDFRRSIEQNAARLYEASKSAKQKLERLEVERQKKEEELSTLPAKEEKPVKKRPRKKWFEKFRWFRSSDGFLVIGGKDAKQNDMIYSKYLKPGDYVFHADIPGASLVVVQAEAREITKEVKREAAEFSAAHSKAWSKGLGTVDVFGVRPEQVSKSPPSGMALAKGSFMITGEREWFRNQEIKLSVGVAIDREKEVIKVVTGPVLALRKNADYFITIKPGFRKSLELARSIKTKLLLRSSVEDKPYIEGVELEEIQRKIPSGMGEIVEFG